MSSFWKTHVIKFKYSKSQGGSTMKNANTNTTSKETRSLAKLYKEISQSFENPYVKDTVGNNYRIYLYLGKQDGFRNFINYAKKEGITFGDNVDISTKPYADILALNENMTVNYVGMWGTMAFRHPEASSRYVVRIDFAKYMAGEKDYFYTPANS